MAFDPAVQIARGLDSRIVRGVRRASSAEAKSLCGFPVGVGPKRKIVVFLFKSSDFSDEKLHILCKSLSDMLSVEL